MGVFYHPIESKWLDLFDAILLPYKNNEYYLAKNYSQVYEVGWINKYIKIKKRPKIQDVRILYMPSNLSYTLQNYSGEQYRSTFKPLFELGIDIKPIHYGGIEKLMKIWRDEKKVNILDMGQRLFEIIDDYDIVISHNESSVTYESSLSGKPTIALQDHADRFAKVPDYPNLYKYEIQQTADFIKQIRSGTSTYKTGEDILRPFNYEQVVKIIG